MDKTGVITIFAVTLFYVILWVAIWLCNKLNKCIFEFMEERFYHSMKDSLYNFIIISLIGVLDVALILLLVLVYVFSIILLVLGG